MIPSVIRDDLYQQLSQPEAIADLFNFLPDAYFYVKNASGQFVQINPAMYKILDISEASEVIGKRDQDFYPPALANAYRIEDLKIMESRKSLPNQLWLVPHVRGTPHWYISSKTPLINRSDDAIGIAGVMYRVESPESQQQWFGKLYPAIQYIDAHFRDHIQIEAVAKHAQLSVSHLNRLFRKLLHSSVSRYITSRKVQEAQRLLTHTNKTISTIGLEVGFYDQSHFTRIFRKETGLTPRGYSKMFRSSS